MQTEFNKIICGWVVDKNATSDEIWDKINKIKNEPKEYEKVKANFKNFQLKTVAQMQENYEKIYQAIPQKSGGVVKLEKINHCITDSNESYIKELLLEEKRKEEYIHALECINAQKDEQIERAKQQIKQKQDTIVYYENMRVIKLIKKLKKRRK